MSDFANGTAGREIEVEVGRAQLPDWPRLLSLQLASAYFGVCAARFRALEIRPVRIGRRVLWDRHDLDRFVDGMSGQPVKGGDPASEARAMERRFFARLKKHEQGKTAGR